MAPRTLIVCLLAVGVSIAPSAGFGEPARHALPLRSGEVQDSVTLAAYDGPIEQSYARAGSR